MRSSERFLRCAVSILALLALAGCPGSSEAPRDEVQRLLEEQRIDEAITHLEMLLDASPDAVELNRLYGAMLLSVGETSQAIWPLLKAAENADSGPEDHLMLARAHLSGGSPSDAIAVIDEVLLETSDILEAYQLRISAQLALNQPEKALADVEYILRHKPDDSEMLISRASLLLELERFGEAKEAIEAAQSVMDSPDAPDTWAARFCAIGASLVFEHGEDGSVERAAKAWNACLEKYPGDSLVVTEAVGFFDGQGDPSRSEEILRRAVEETRQSVGFLASLGQRLAARSEHEEAEEMLRQAVESEGGIRARPILIEYYSEREEYDKALEVLTEWLDIQPFPPANLRIMHADLLVRAGEFDAAKTAIAEIEKPEFRNLLEGRLALEQDDAERALDLLEQGILLWPSNAVARILAAEAASQLGDFDRSLSEYIEALRADPENWEALVKVEAMHHALHRPEPIGQLVNRYVSANPNDRRGHRLKFEIGMWSGRDEMARSAIRTFASLPGGRPTAIAFGARLRALQDPAEAVVFVASSQLNLTQPASAEALTVLVDNQLALSRHDGALAQVDAAISAHPDFAPFHELRARALAAADAPPQEIRASLERALELEPDWLPALLALGRLDAREANLDAALAHFDRGAAVDEIDSEAEWAAVQALLAAGREESLDARLEEILTNHGEHAGACELAARRIVTKEGDLARARSLTERSVRLRGGATALATLGGVYRRLGETEDAIRMLRRSLDLRSDSPSTRYELGVALARSGDADAARAEFEKALESEDFPEEAQVRIELSKLGPRSG